jgi:hypothetical protein
MEQLIEQKSTEFIERRQSGDAGAGRANGPERRQFTNTHCSERPAVVELAEAVDQYKLRHRRRFITYEELYDVIAGLGYTQ